MLVQGEACCSRLLSDFTHVQSTLLRAAVPSMLPEVAHSAHCRRRLSLDEDSRVPACNWIKDPLRQLWLGLSILVANAINQSKH